MRSVLAVSLLVAATSAGFPKLFRRESAHKEVQQANDWPVVHVLEDFVMEASINTWDAANKKLVPFKRMTLSQKFDTDGNRAYTDMASEIDGIGYIHVESYIDYTTSNIVQRIQDLAICNTLENPLPIHDLKAFMAQVMDPKGGLTTYLGVKNEEWAGHETYAYQITFDTDKGKKSETLHFCTKSLDLKWITVEGFDQIMKVDTYKAQTFTDADFPFTSCSAMRHGYFTKELPQIPHVKALF
jgi:hypothetical protein